MNNSVFGRTMENIENRVDIKFATDRKKALKYSSKPNFNRAVIFDENLVACHMNKTQINYNKPIYLGASILDISKTLMIEFHYDYIKPKYGDRAKLLLTDTDSLLYEITTEDFYQDIAEDIESRFDTSDYPKDHPAVALGFKAGCNKKVLGMMKDECAGKQITEFVGLRAKCYAYTVDGKDSKKCKGVKKGVVRKRL
jgi:CRISPR/Cas system CSM-associated protein Csm5 (group 7 of RAMP superfamily)